MFPRVVFLVSAILLATFASVQAEDRSTYLPTIKEVKALDNGSVQITFTTMPETLYYCPGANSKTTDKGLELSFVRSSTRKSPKVAYPAKNLKKDGTVAKVITIPAPTGSVFVKYGKHLTKLLPKDPEHGT